MKKKKTSERYTGIADCHGIESFMKKKDSESSENR